MQREGSHVAADELFQSLSLEMLRAFVADHKEENLHLDFKLLVGGPELDRRDDRRNLAKALSGFANASGGVIIWGVNARKNEEGIDCAVELQEIPGLPLLLSRLNALTGEAVDPLVDGIQHRVIEAREHTGFAATLVPESDRGPHMAKLGEDRYFKRSGDSFYKMEHFDIADMFGRRRRPRLEMTYRVRAGGTEIVVGLRNVGRASARAPYLAVSTAIPFHRNIFGLDGNRHEGMTFLAAEQPHRPPWRYGASADFVIHPGVTHEVASLTKENNKTPVPDTGVVIEFAIACEGIELTEGTLVLQSNELQ